MESLLKAMRKAFQNASAGLSDPDTAGRVTGRGTGDGRIGTSSHSGLSAHAAASGLTGEEGAAGTGTVGTGGNAAGDTAGDSEEKKKKLKRVGLRDGEAGRRAMSGAGKNRSPNAATAIRAPNEEEIAAKLSLFLERLKRGSAAGSTGRGGDREEGEESASSSGLVLPDGDIDSKYKSPTLEALQKIRKGSAHSYRMSGTRGEMDGSKDRGGTGFDGNNEVKDIIPLEKSKGAFGKEIIKLEQSSEE